jgi:NADPH:quinone reductase-like Zn-dependent oxidoreductase
MKLRYKLTLGMLILFFLATASLAYVLSHTAACPPAPADSGDVDSVTAVIYRCYGPPDVLRLEEIQKPVPEDDEVLVRIRSAGVNPLDWHYMRGAPYVMRLMSGLGAPEEPRLGVDFAGTVEAVGRNASRFTPGDEVFGSRTGAFGEYVTVNVNRAIVPKPASITFEQAAGVGIAGVTALQALRDKGQLKPGQKVLINGASGGVGTFAVQIAKAMGAEVTAVCSTRNVEMVQAIGADYVFDYTRENYTESGERYDLIVDMVGNHPLRANTRVLKPEGRLVIVGGPKGDWLAPLIPPVKAMVYAPFVDQEIHTLLAELRQEDLTVLSDLMAAGKVVPIVDRSFALAEIREAIEYSESGRARGKIIIDVD